MRFNAFMFELQIKLTAFHRRTSLFNSSNVWTGSLCRPNISKKDGVYLATVGHDGP